MLECTIMRVVRCPIVDLRTQWMVLSAQNNNPEVASYRDGTLQHQSACHRRKTQRHRRQQGCRRSSSTPSSWHAEVSPTRPEEPSLASVGSGMAAGAAFGHPRVRDARVRPNSKLVQPYVTQMYILLTQRAGIYYFSVCTVCGTRQPHPSRM